MKRFILPVCGLLLLSSLSTPTYAAAKRCTNQIIVTDKEGQPAFGRKVLIYVYANRWLKATSKRRILTYTSVCRRLHKATVVSNGKAYRRNFYSSNGVVHIPVD